MSTMAQGVQIMNVVMVAVRWALEAVEGAAVVRVLNLKSQTPNLAPHFNVVIFLKTRMISSIYRL